MKKKSGVQKGSKNKKRYWRRGVDIKDIEQHLDFERETQRFLGDVKGKSNEELFVIEKVADSEFETAIKEEKPEGLTDGLKVHKALTNTGGYPAFESKTRKKVKRSWEKKVPSKVLKLVGRSKKQDSSRTADSTLTESISVDVWSEEPLKTPLRPDLEDFYLRQTRKKMVNIPRTRSQTHTTVPKVQLPHPGISYNPDFQHHQEYLADLVAVEESKVAKEENLAKKLSLPKGVSYATQATKDLEMSEGLFREAGWREIKEERDSDEEGGRNQQYIPVPPPVTAESRKLRSQKRKEIKERMERAERERAREEKRRLHDVYRLKSLKVDLKAEEAKTESKIAKRKKRKADKLNTAATLSKYKFQEPEKEVQLSDELTGSLRLLKPEGSLLVDRFKSFQKRNIIEVRERQKFKRKYPLKSYTKRSHRKPEA